jgi:hypothetical protein
MPLIRTFARVIGPIKSFRLLVMHLEQQLSIAIRNESLSYRTGVLWDRRVLCLVADMHVIMFSLYRDLHVLVDGHLCRADCLRVFRVRVVRIDAMAVPSCCSTSSAYWANIARRRPRYRLARRRFGMYGGLLLSRYVQVMRIHAASPGASARQSASHPNNAAN